MAKRGATHVFRAKTCTEAIGKATAKLGRNISIVNRREVREENLFSKLTAGKLGGDMMEVELEVEVSEPDAAKSGTEPPADPKSNHLLDKTYARALASAARRPAPVDAALCTLGSASAGLAGRLDEMQRAVIARLERDRADLRGELRSLLSLQARGGVPNVSPELIAEYQRLVDEADMAEDVARNVVEMVHSAAGAGGAGMLRSALRGELARRIPAAGPILLREGKTTVAALVGPTGAGKSTTIAKLAVDFALRKKKTVGLINEDDTRPGADCQMKNLGQIMSLPVKSVNEPAQAAEAVRAMGDLDLVLVDTGGRSPRDVRGMEKLREVIRAVKPDETHLVLASGVSEKLMFHAVARFRNIGFDRLILTKLDEAITHGGILNLFSKLADGLSYVTTGQKYLESLVAADGDLLARLILGMAEVAEGGVRETAAAAGDE
ncbi:MAG: hypothetical protein LBT97_04940 [Planctomycetota bacterium]|jgi:flagellar biosynthesis protein FlhF|nr:hypothetical protein [Planctomycetota bacterium]